MNALQRFIILALLPQFGMSQTCIPRPSATRVDPLYTNQRLDGYQVSHLMGFTLERCALECFLVRLCASFNFREHLGVCALNNVTVGDVGEDKLVGENDFVHHELQAWNDNQTMAGTCASRPCDENQRCIQTTPVHTCVAVDCGPPPRYIEPHRLKDALVTSSVEVTSVGSRAEYTCDGHWIDYQYNFEAPFYNSSTKICNSDFTWSKNKPVCNFTVSWTVIVKTGNVDRANTNARVYIIVKGKEGWTGQFKLDNADNNFEKSNTDIFTNVTMRDVGEVEELKVWHDNAGNDPGWFLDEIQLVSQGGGETYTFPCYQWLRDAEVLERTLQRQT